MKSKTVEELKGIFKAEISVPYNYEYVVKDEFQFGEYLSKILTKKWFGNGVWRVDVAKPLFEKNNNPHIVVEIEIPIGVTQSKGISKFTLEEFISKSLTKKWFGNGVWGVNIMPLNDDTYAKGGNILKGFDYEIGGLWSNENNKLQQGGNVENETYLTLTWKTNRQAKKAENEIREYFDSRFISSEILFGKDERGNEGYYVSYVIKK